MKQWKKFILSCIWGPLLVAQIMMTIKAICKRYRELISCWDSYGRCDVVRDIELIKEGYGEGSFVVIKAIK